ncbi:hypothetical protein BDW02DRAFT_277374 [Decorospora gaudefroyi]|uniref:Membrane anchor Opy2 N-terminal domain-containing protein n=1 Tax=Decorospora gaudefroyi TaxID=184978 RepID=A0A6A5KCD4_9PLEO|nr:hypothetical protein BDW02DRAFT_277374 [Decorospora gaudefroyi]
MSTTIATRQAEQTTASNTSRRASSTSTTLRRRTTTPGSLLASASPTELRTSLESDFSFVLETASPTPSQSNSDTSSVFPTASIAIGAIETCSTDDDCVTGKTCSNAKCVSSSVAAAPFGGSGSEPTSQLSQASAIGVAAGVVGFMALVIGLGFWFWRKRGNRPRKESIETPSHNRNRSASNATDQKTLVASLPNSPQSAGFTHQQSMPLGFSAKALEYNQAEKKNEDNGSESRNNSSDVNMEKALPLAPENPLPPPPTEPKRYAVNVNIDKSSIFDDDMMNAVSIRGNDTPRSSGTPRDRTQYRFEEYIPRPTNTPPISISRAPEPTKRNSEYELDQYPNKRSSADTVSSNHDSSRSDSRPPSPILESLAKLESKAPQIPLPDLPPPSPSFSFRSYDWYQDIISDQPSGEPTTPTIPSRNPARTPTQATFPKPLSLSPKKLKDVDASLIPEPLSPAAPSVVSGLHLHPNSAALASPTSPKFRLPPTVYTMPSRPSVTPTPPPRSPVRASMFSTMTRTTHNSRSWLPDDGLYLAEEEEDFTNFKKFRRPSDPSRPTSYSPLT